LRETSGSSGAGKSLGDVLAPRLFSDVGMVKRMADWMRQGRALVIPDAFPTDFAEQVHRDLDAQTEWDTQQAGHDFFHFHNYVISVVRGRSTALTECHEL